jgi:hypothetical protein
MREQDKGEGVRDRSLRFSGDQTSTKEDRFAALAHGTVN